jgi:hypothetical protein
MIWNILAETNYKKLSNGNALTIRNVEFIQGSNRRLDMEEKMGHGYKDK